MLFWNVNSQLCVDDSAIENFDYDPTSTQEIDYKARFKDFLTRWCARCQNREPMTRAAVAANEFGIKMQTYIETGEWPIEKV